MTKTIFPPPANKPVLIALDGVLYDAADLAWKMSYGVDPKGKVKHRNGLLYDNRLANLYDSGVED